MAGSLLDNDDFSSIGSSGGGSKGSSIDTGNMIKIGVIVSCMGVAALLFAYQAGWILQPKPPADTRTPDQVQEDDEAFEQQERIREKLKTLPGYQQGDA